MFNMLRKRGVLLSWFLSYTLILFIPFILGVYSYAEMQKVVRTQILRTNDTILEQAQTVLDSLVLDMERLGYQMTFDREVISLSSAITKFDGEQQFQVKTLIDFLSQQKATNTYIDDIYIYFENVDRVVTSTTLGSAKDMYRLFNPSDDSEYDNWINLISKKHSNEFLSAKN